MTSTALKRISTETLREIHARMTRIRAFESTFQEYFHALRRESAQSAGSRFAAFTYGDPLSGPALQGNLELSLGQETVAAAILPLRPGDYLAGTHRAHHHALAKGVEVEPLVAEMFGRATGLCGGRAGDFNVHDVEHGFENSPVVGQLMPVATGHALAAQLQGRDDVAMVAVGDGGINQGVFHESANLAGLWRLPLIFLLENNGYALSTSARMSSPIPHRLYTRAQAYGFPGVLVEDNDPLTLYEAATAAVDRARAGEGPTLIELRTDRLSGGFEGDKQGYRPAGELETAHARDALPRLSARLLEAGVLAAGEADDLLRRERARVAAAIAAANAAPWPDPHTATRGVFTETQEITA
ncbi:thiamine pyrophosphate-dependent dehydrogenase E1 component subunit alpha [Mycolicibacterium sp.]|uniref:thiamine pyrophosphate-dependent dehydrogenase E1 component subunit alpha n=1 Tax=Mycolicibacterium sp. TaxID=2320850 RepID=UPI003D10BF67